MKYQELLETLDKFPKIDTFAVKLDSGEIVEPEFFRFESKDRENIEQQIVSVLGDYIRDKRVWVRVMPEIKSYEEDGLTNYHCRTRLGVL